MVPHLSIIIPAYNEARRLGHALEALSAFCAELAFAYEVLVVVEPSTDGTLDLARELAAPHPCFVVIDNVVHRGKGYAVRNGMLRARGAHVFYMDADLSVPLREVRVFLDYFDAHPDIDVLVGNRQHAQSRITRRQSLLRRKLGQSFNAILQMSGLVSLHDTQCGFKAFRHRAAEAIFSRQRLDGFAFDVEVLLLARRLGYSVADLPVEWINSPESHVHIVRDSFMMLWDTVRIARRFARESKGSG